MSRHSLLAVHVFLLTLLRFGDYPDLVSQYRYNVYGRSSSHDLSCDAQCVHETICSVSSIVTADQSKCSAG